MEVGEIHNLGYPAAPLHDGPDPVQSAKATAHDVIKVLKQRTHLECKPLIPLNNVGPGRLATLAPASG